MPSEARVCSLVLLQRLVAQPQHRCYLAFTVCPTSVFAQHAGFSVQIGQSAKSFADDLALGQGVVRPRAVSLLRFSETQPFDGEICSIEFLFESLSTATRWRCSLLDIGYFSQVFSASL